MQQEEDKAPPPANPNSEVLRDMHTLVTESVGADALDVSGILALCVKLMKYVEDLSKFSGPVKKDLVISSLMHFCVERGISPAILEAVPPFIDTAISLSRGDIKISDLASSAKKAGFSCFGCSGK